MSKRRRRYSQAFKLAAVARFESAESVRELAAELGVDRGLVYKWRAAHQAGGAEALGMTGRPRRSAAPPGLLAGRLAEDAGPPGARRIAELERMVGRQQLELDFFRAALQRLKDRRRPSGGPFDPTSTR